MERYGDERKIKTCKGRKKKETKVQGKQDKSACVFGGVGALQEPERWQKDGFMQRRGKVEESAFRLSLG